MRIAQCTDVHWTVVPDLMHVPFSKRILGTLNLYILGRWKRFDEAAQMALPQAMLDARADAVMVTGDLTSTATPMEFEKARAALKPVLDAVPTLVIPGNHDVYTVGAGRSQRIRRYFGPWMHLNGSIARLEVGDTVIFGLDPCRPWFDATGIIPDDQLQRIGESLDDPALDGKAVVLALHYPILGKDGLPYTKRDHRLHNADALVERLRKARRKPDLIVHGHEHHGFTANLVLDGVTVPIHDPGTGGYRRDDAHGRAAAFNVYELGVGGLTAVERYLWDGTGFVRETRAYAER